MYITLENVGIYITVITFMVMIVKYTVINPQQEKMESFKDIVQASFNSLKESIDELKRAIERSDCDAMERKERLIIAEKRIDNIEKRLDVHENQTTKTGGVV